MIELLLVLCTIGMGPMYVVLELLCHCLSQKRRQNTKLDTIKIALHHIFNRDFKLLSCNSKYCLCLWVGGMTTVCNLKLCFLPIFLEACFKM